MTKPPFDNVLARQAVNFAIDRAPARRPGRQAGRGDLPDPAAELRRVRALLPLHHRAHRGRRLDGARPRPRPAAREAVGHRRRVGHGAHPDVLRASAPHRAATSPPCCAASATAHATAVVWTSTRSSPVRENVSFNGWFADFLAAGRLPRGDRQLPREQARSRPEHPRRDVCDPGDRPRVRPREDAADGRPRAGARFSGARSTATLTDAAPWVAYLNPGELELLSSRVGNYEYSPQWGTLLDQLWVR